MIKIIAIISLILTVSCGRDIAEQAQPATASVDGFNSNGYSNRHNHNNRSGNRYDNRQGPYRYSFNWHYIEYQERKLTSLEKEALEAQILESKSKAKLNDAQRQLIELAARQLRQEITKLKKEVKDIKSKVIIAKKHTKHLNRLLASGEVDGDSLNAYKYFISEYNISTRELRNIKVEPLTNNEFTRYGTVVTYPIKEFTAEGTVDTYLTFLRNSTQNINPESNKAMGPLVQLADLIQERNQAAAKDFESRQKEIDEEMQAKWDSLTKTIHEINQIATNS